MVGGDLFFEVKNLTKQYGSGTSLFARHKNINYALENVSIDIYKSERLAIIGETGSGKTTLGKCLIRLTRASSGTVSHNDSDLLSLSNNEYRDYRKKFQMIFQNPAQSLNPVQDIYSTISEPLKNIIGFKGDRVNKRITELLHLVQFDDTMIHRFPHELSGGQKQRVAIARALTVNPDLIIADEPTSFLDAGLKLAIVNLINSLWQNLGLTLILISHDLSMVSHISDRIAVMYKGILVEIADTSQLFCTPLHPYTQQLIRSDAAIPDIRSGEKMINFNQGCRFASRCGQVQEKCLASKPTFNLVDKNHGVACHYFK